MLFLIRTRLGWWCVLRVHTQARHLTAVTPLSIACGIVFSLRSRLPHCYCNCSNGCCDNVLTHAPIRKETDFLTSTIHTDKWHSRTIDCFKCKAPIPRRYQQLLRYKHKLVIFWFWFFFCAPFHLLSQLISFAWKQINLADRSHNSVLLRSNEKSAIMYDITQTCPVT